MSRRASIRLQLEGLRITCADLIEPLWKPAPYIRGRHTPPELRAQVQRDARAAAFEWLSRRVGKRIEFDFDDVTDAGTLQRCIAALEPATIYTVERDPGFAATPYGAAMIEHWKAKQAAFKAEFGEVIAFRESQQARLREARER